MIQLAHPVHPTEGYSVDLSCPVVVCDVCREFIDSAHPGFLVWSASVPPAHAHQGRCIRAAETRFGHLSARPVGEWLEQLARNYASPLIGAEVTLSMGEKITVAEVRL